MLLTFLNVIVVRGILVGLPEGSRIAYENQFSGDVIVTPASQRTSIQQTPYVENVIVGTEGYIQHSLRYTQGGVLTANYRDARSPKETDDSVGTQVVGINTDREDALTGLASMLIEGEYLSPNDTQGILVGSQLLDRYSLVGGSENETVANVFPDDKVRLAINGFEREYTVRGIVKSKVGENSRRVFMAESEARRIMGRYDFSANEIAVRIADWKEPAVFAQKLRDSGVSEYALVQTAVESQGQFLEDIRATFEVLSAVIGVIGIAVATITVFIVIFIFAVTRQKQIGILKGIGINRIAIASSFVFLSVFYSLLGIGLGLLLLYGFIQPYILEHPINFPFADGILVAEYADTLLRSVIIVVATVIAGYVPARLIIKKNTINSILGR
jgi:ABC-type lipoprotein release transport system permease subunit